MALPIGPTDIADLSPAIHTTRLAKSYRNVTALAGLDMTVERGEVFGFLGPNGAGKTTAVKLLLGLARPTGGEAFVLGAPVGDLDARRRIGYLPELFRYQEWLKGREVLALHCALARLPRSTWAGNIAAALAAVGLESRADSKVGTYSKGMQQRLGLAVALVGEPELIVLDEPTSALDPVGRYDVREVIHGLKQRGVTVFLNSHLLTEVEHVCDRVAVVDRGTLVALNSVHELTADLPGVRVRCTGLPDELVTERFHNFGRLRFIDGWLQFDGVEPTSVPDLVEQLIELGGRIYAVEPRHRTLEERFLEILKGAQVADPDHRATHAV